MKKYLSILLITFVFIMQFAGSSTVSTVAAQQTVSKIPYIEYMSVHVEGVKNLKLVNQNERLNVPDNKVWQC